MLLASGYKVIRIASFEVNVTGKVVVKIEYRNTRGRQRAGNHKRFPACLFDRGTYNEKQTQPFACFSSLISVTKRKGGRNEPILG